MVVIATDIPSTIRRPGVYRGALHETSDQEAMFKPVTKATFQAGGPGELGNVGAKKLTVQTEVFPNPWRIETKIYLGGALKKVYTEDLSQTAEDEMQKRINEFHQAKLEEIVAGLRRLAQ